jgi:glycosidase
MHPRALIEWLEGAARPALLVAAAFAAGLPAHAGGLRLHVPSPDWRDQVIYFVMTDRFADGNPGNNDQGAGEYKAGELGRYNGGDLAGLRQRLDYIQGLGATSVWITPPVANQWIDPAGNYGGFHGYWAENFMQVDKHLGSLDDYRLLSDALHRRGMYLVQDIVVNHTGNYFAYRGGWDPADPSRYYDPHTASPPAARPTQPPFDQNDPRDPAQRRAGIYHWTPDVRDYNDRQQELNFQMASLDDLNTESPRVRQALRHSYGYWIREVGVDAFRVDTAFYVPPEYFADFMGSRDPVAPGMNEIARRTGRARFLVFGEGFGIDQPGQDGQSRKIESYMTQRRPGLPPGTLMSGMLNFPLYGALGDTFARGRPPAELADRIQRMMRTHARPHLMPSFVDNHDVDRFLAGGSETGLRQALLAIMTLPGIPVIYYGTEQGFREQRAAMFATGFGSGGRDHFDTGAPLYRTVAELTALRRSHRVLSRGHPTVLHANGAQAGALAWRMDMPRGADRAATPGQAFIVFNTGQEEALLPQLDTGLPAGTVLRGVYGLGGRPADLVAGPGGRVSLRLAAGSGQVWVATRGRQSLAPTPSRLSVDPLPAERFGGDFEVQGSASAVTRPLLVVDGDLAAARPLELSPEGRWKAMVDTSRMIDPTVRHTLTAWSEGEAVAPSVPFVVARQWQTVADVEDPAGDDHGPRGRYAYPSDVGWGDNRQMDLKHVRVSTSGGALRLDVTTAGMTAAWSPPMGFDHVAFTIYIELPGLPGGETVMPLQNASLPAGMRWHRRLRVGGWSNALHAPEGASATSEGRSITPAARVEVDRSKNTLSLVLPASVLKGSAPLTGARIYVTTWDYDGGYRALAPEVQAFAMGGGEPTDPRVMDDSAVIVVP